jgi:arsenate reductase
MRLLFVCVENSCRSQMAEGFARALADVEAHSAGSRPSGQVDPRAVRFMAESGIDISSQRSTGLEGLETGGVFDYVITMGCGDVCPQVPTRQRFDWDLADPKHMSDREFRAVRDSIERRVKALIGDRRPRHAGG